MSCTDKFDVGSSYQELFHLVRSCKCTKKNVISSFKIVVEEDAKVWRRMR
jgi:hypothetical protein